MKTIVFNSGGFPLETDTLINMQDAYIDILKALYSRHNIQNSGNYILAGVSKNGSVLSDGWLIVDGELYKFTGGSGLYIQLNTANTSVTYEDTVSKVTYVWKTAVATATASGNTHVDAYLRVSNNMVIVRGDCVHLADRVYKYQLEANTTSIHLDNEGDLVTTNGFILNRIDPFTDIEHGHELLIRLGAGTGLTYLTKNLVASNILFNQAETTNSGQKLIRPIFGNGVYIGSASANPLTYDGVGYDQNVHVKVQWDSVSQKWKEIARFTIKEGSV